MTPFQKQQLVLMRRMEDSLAHGNPAATVVDMQTDYANDPQLCLSFNSYISADTDAAIRRQIIRPLTAIDPLMYYYPEGSLHITIHSIRIIRNPPAYTPDDIAMAQLILSRMAHSESPFEFLLSGVMCMPTSVSVIALITPQYDRFVRSLRRAFADNGIPSDKTYFTDEIVFANITVCRFTHAPDKKFRDAVAGFRDMSLGSIVISKADLVETNAGAHPSKTSVYGSYIFAGK